MLHTDADPSALQAAYDAVWARRLTGNSGQSCRAPLPRRGPSLPSYTPLISEAPVIGLLRGCCARRADQVWPIVHGGGALWRRWRGRPLFAVVTVGSCALFSSAASAPRIGAGVRTTPGAE